MILILQVFYSALSGLFLAAAIPNEFFLLGCPFFAVFALVPYYLTISQSKNYKEAFICGFTLTAVAHVLSSFWLAYFKDFALLTLGASGLYTALLNACFALLQYLPYADAKARNPLLQRSLFQKVSQSVCFRIIYFAAVYTLYEWCKSIGFIGYPWGTLSTCVYKWPVLMQIASITGTYGISFTLLLFNAFIAELLILQKTNYDTLEKNRKQNLIISLNFITILLAVELSYGSYEYFKPRKVEKILSTIFVQQNSDPWKEKNDTKSILNSQALTYQAINQMLIENKSPELVIWSEGTLKYYFPNSQNYYKKNPIEKPLSDFIKELNTTFIIGGGYTKNRELKQFNNVAIVFDKDANIRGYYAKNHLVPFAEALPGIEFPAIREFMTKIVGISAGWTPGDQYVLFDLPCHINPDKGKDSYQVYDLSKPYQEKTQPEACTVRISTPICYDDAFPDVMRPLFLGGTELFANITDDSWSLKASSEYQHFVVASYRSIEFRTPMIRSTNAGYSVVLDPCGRILCDMPLFQEYSKVFDIPIYEREMTFYAKYGNWFPKLIFIFCIIFSCYMYKNFVPWDYIPSERKLKKKKIK